MSKVPLNGIPNRPPDLKGVQTTTSAQLTG